MHPKSDEQKTRDKALASNDEAIKKFQKGHDFSGLANVSNKKDFTDYGNMEVNIAASLTELKTIAVNTAKTANTPTPKVEVPETKTPDVNTNSTVVPTINGDSSLNAATSNINIPSGDFTAPLGMGDNSVQFKGLLDNVKNGSFDSMMNTKKTMSEFQVPNPADPKSVSTNFAQQKISDDAVASQNSNNDSNTNNLTKSLDSTNQAIGKIGSGAGSIGTLANDFGVSSNSALGNVLGAAQTGVQAASAVTNLMSIFGTTAATGGHITGPGSGTSDSIPVMLSNGEFVVNAASTANHRGLLESINTKGKIPKFALGGLINNTNANSVTPVGYVPDSTKANIAKNAAAASAANKTQNSTFHINVTGDISTQTRKEIQAMIPQIASGVNAQNRELGNMLTSY